jgi:putative MFS transporter
MPQVKTSAQPLTPIAARIERLPVGPFHRRFITVLSLGGWFDFYDIFVVAYVGAALQQSGFLTLKQFSFLVSAGFLGMFVGTIVFGIGSDRMGRRTAFIFMLLIYSAFTLAGALSPSATWLIVFRFLAGIGIGAETVVIGTYATEIVPMSVRGRYVAITQAVGFTAVPVAALLSRALVPTNFLMSGWRWVMVIGAFGALFAWQLRRKLPESPRWLEARGRTGEADAIMRAIELEAGVKPEDSADAELTAVPAVVEQKGSFAELFRPPYLRRTIMLMAFHALQTIGFYGFSNWAPTFLLSKGITLVKSLNYSITIATLSPLGPILAALSSDKLERKWTIVVLSVLIALFGLGFSNASTPTSIMMTGATVTVLNYWFSPLVHTYQNELYPTRIRASGVGFTYSWSRLSSALNSLLIGQVLTHGVGAVFILISSAMLSVAVILTLFGPKTNRQTLEELSR